MTPLEKRAAAVRATVEHFNDKPFIWGENDCGRLSAFDLRQLGYRVNLAKYGFYNSDMGSYRALVRAGFHSTEETIDDIVGPLSRIRPDTAIIGDICAIRAPGERLAALCVAIGQGRVLGFHHDETCHVIEIPKWNVDGCSYTAWRCDPVT
jgi:hypothetical protein